MKRSLLIVSALLACSACTSETSETASSPPTLSEQLAGHWTSSACESYPGPNGTTTHLKRDVTLTASSWKVDVIIYGDAACTSPFLGASNGGTYTVGAASSVVQGATDVDYAFSFRKITALADAATSVLSSCGSGTWVVGQEQDVTANGCAALVLPSLADCPMEHDLNRIDDSALYFGDRSGDLCTTRPTKLTTYAVVRQ